MSSSRRRLYGLTERLREPPPASGPPAPGPDERFRAVAFADALELVPAPQPLRHELGLLAHFSRTARRIPSASERGVIRAAPPDATLETIAGELAAAAESAPRPRVNWAALDEAEQRDLEALVELALGKVGFFAKRRGEQATELSIDELARFAERPSGLSQVVPRGAAVLPAGVLDDLAAGRLLGGDVGVLAVVLLLFAGRRFDPRVERYLSWTDAGATLVARGGLHRLAERWGPELAPDSGVDAVAFDRPGIARRLVAARWLDVTEERDGVRIRLGERLLREAGRRARRPRETAEGGTR